MAKRTQPHLVWDQDDLIQDDLDSGSASQDISENWHARLNSLFVKEQSRLVLWAPVLFGCGISTYFSLPYEPLFYPLLILFGVSVAACSGLKHHRLWHVFFIVLSLITAGLMVAKIRTLMVAAPVLQSEIGPIRVQGQITRQETLPRNNLRLTLKVQNMEMAGEWPEYVRVTVRTKVPALSIGDVVRLRVVLTPPAEPVTPGAFDFARQAYFQQLGGVGYAITSPEIVQESPDNLSHFWEQLRYQLSQRIKNAIPGDAGAIAAALLVGERGALSNETAQAYRDAGLAHLLAISGLHFGLVAAALVFLTRFILVLIPYVALNWPVKEVSAVIAWGGAFFYLVISGAPLPAQRAFIMTSVILFALILGRQPISLRLVAFAALIILLISPEALLSVSFQMSFAAVIALISVYETLRLHSDILKGPKRGWGTKIGLYVAGVGLSTIVAEIAIDPIAAFHFNTVARYGLFANIFAVPLTAFWIMPWGLFAMVLMPFGLENFALVPMGLGIEALSDIATMTAQAPGAVWVTQAFSIGALSLSCFGGLWLCIWQHEWRFFGVPIIAGALFWAWISPAPTLLIAPDGKMLSMQGERGRIFLSTKRGSGITKETWIRRWGQEKGHFWLDDPVFVNDHWLRCDDLGCAWKIGQTHFAYAKEYDAIEDDCRSAAIIITSLSVATCNKDVELIDARRLMRDGALALYAPVSEDGKWQFVSSAVERGARPWVRSISVPLNQSGIIELTDIDLNEVGESWRWQSPE